MKSNHRCYLCHSQTEFFLKKQGYKLYKCPSCGLITTEFHRNYLSFVQKFYSKGYFTGDPKYSAFSGYEKDKVCITRNLNKVLQKVRPYVPAQAKLLDAGCAMGYMVELAQSYGYKGYGFDPSTYALSRASASVSKYLKQATIDSASYPKHYFDVVTMTDIIEHVSDPIKNLKKIRNFLKPKGIVVIATGDTESLAAKILRKRWTFFIPPQHLIFMSKKNLKEILNKSGYKPLTWFRVGKWLSLEYILHLAQCDGEYPFASSMQKISNFLHIGGLELYLPMQDNMVVVARKI